MFTDSTHNCVEVIFTTWQDRNCVFTDSMCDGVILSEMPFNNNCPTKSCVRLYNVYFLYITAEHQTDIYWNCKFRPNVRTQY